VESSGADPNQSETPPGNTSQVVTATGGSHITGVIQGHNVIGNILVTGDGNQIFTGSYERLRDAYINPKSVFERVRVDRFFGRRWLIEKVEAFLEKNESGYFILEGTAGLGKTAFLAHLVQKLSAIHHFVELAPGQDGIAPGLKSLAAQIIIAWKLLPQGADEVVPDKATRPEFLQGLLFEAAQQRDETKPDEKIIVIVDALDEAGVHKDQNVLGLPKVLPQGVYFIVSQRPVEIALATPSVYREVFTLEANAQQNLDDMKGFLEEAATWELVRQAIEGSNYTPADFVRTLLAKCAGVWIYLKYVVNEIERGERFPLVLETLPQGLWQFYAQYWQSWRKQDDWDNVQLPLLSGLAAIQEDVTLTALCDLTGVTEQGAKIRRLLDETWRPFLAVIKEDGKENRYRLYHASLREFLDGRADLTELTEQEKTFTRELANATRETHGRMADSILQAWGGIENNLTTLQDGSSNGPPKLYGLKHLAAHLEAAGRANELHRLLKLEWFDEETIPITRTGWRGFLDRVLGREHTRTIRHYKNAWYAAQKSADDVSGYVNDVERAWRLARASQVSPASLSVRYALITASLNSLAQNITPALLKLLVETKTWTVSQAWVYARQAPDAQQRAEALILIHPYLPSSLQDECIRIAFINVQAIPYAEEQMRLLKQLAPHLSEELKNQAAKHNWQEWRGWNLKALEALAPELSERVLCELIDALRKGQEWDRGRMLVPLLAELPEPRNTEVAQEIYLEMISQEGYAKDFFYRSATDLMLTAGVAPYLPEPLKTEAFASIFTTAGALKHIISFTSIADIPGSLVPHLPAAMKDAVIPEILTEIENNDFPRNRLTALASLAPHVTDPAHKGALINQITNSLNELNQEDQHIVNPILVELAQSGYVTEALGMVATIKREFLKTEILAQLAPFLSAETLPAAFSLLNNVAEHWDKHKALSALLVQQAQLGGAEEAFAAAGVLENPWKIATITGVFPFVAESRRAELVKEALATAETTRRDYGDQEKVAASIAGALAESGAQQQALDFARSLDGPWMQAAAFARLVPKLQEELRTSVQEETIQKIETLDSYNQTIKFAELIPVFPDGVGPETFRQFLSKAESLAGESLIMEPLAALAPHAPNELRDSIIQQVIAAAELTNNDSGKAEALIAIAGYISSAEVEKLWAIARKVRGSIRREQAFAGIAAYLPASSLPQLLAEAKNNEDASAKWEEISALLPRLAETGDVTNALTLAGEIPSEITRDLALASLAKHLTPDALQELLEEAKTLVDKTSRAYALTALTEHTAEPQKSELAQLAIDNVLGSYDYEFRAKAYATLLPLLPDTAKAETLKRLVNSTQKLYRDARVAIYAALVPHILQLPAPERHSTWNAILQILASKSRGDLFLDLSVFMPVIGSLGGADELLETNRAIEDSVRWWG
jgi:hypothetical protein